MKKIQDLLNKKYGRLTVVKYMGKDKNSNNCWLCECECGGEKIVTTSSLNNGTVKSCGCLIVERNRRNGYITSSKTFKNISNQKFNKWTVSDKYETRGRNRVYWWCKCDCGTEKWVLSYNLRNNISKSCGCLPPKFSEEQIRKNKERNTTHGKSKTRIYKTWRGIKDRCNNKNDMHYPNYGGRGIKVCEEWDNSFESFNSWALENGYDDTLSIDRIDVNGNYEPSNCRWGDAKTQSNNKRNNRYITYNGETKTIKQWAEHFGIKDVTLRARIDRYGLTFEEAVTLTKEEINTLAREKRHSIKILNLEDNSIKTYSSIREFAESINVNYRRIRYCFQKGKAYDKYKLIKE